MKTDWSRARTDQEYRKRCIQLYGASFVYRELFERGNSLPAKPEAKEWDGEWPPPVGCECGMSLSGRMFPQVEITYMGDGVFCYRNMEDGSEYTGSLRDATFHRRRTQAERERDDLIQILLATNGQSEGVAADTIIAAGWRKGDS